MSRLIVFFLLIPISLFSQDTSRYCQKSASMYSDCYTFIRENPNNKVGSFIHKILTDDGQTWFGKGSFKENKRKFILTYQRHYDTLSVNFEIDSTIISDSLLFINKSFCWFPCYFHSPQKPEDAFFYFIDLSFDSTLKSKKIFSKGLFWIDSDSKKFFKIPSTDRLVIISIEYYPPKRITILKPKKKEKLKKTKNGFKVKSLFGVKRKELFIKKE
jgi:hypothetical protein